MSCRFGDTSTRSTPGTSHLAVSRTARRRTCEHNTTVHPVGTEVSLPAGRTIGRWHRGRAFKASRPDHGSVGVAVSGGLPADRRRAVLPPGGGARGGPPAKGRERQGDLRHLPGDPAVPRARATGA